MNNRNQIENLIKYGNIEAAMELLKPYFVEKVISYDCYDLLYQMIAIALEKGDIQFAANNAAHYGRWFSGDVPKNASWNAIVHKAFAQGYFPKLDIRADFLEPFGAGYHISAPQKLNQLCVKVWQLFRDNNWQVPDCAVEFDGYRHLGNSYNKPVLAYQVREIRGKDFLLGFHGVQGLLDVNWNANLNNTGGFNFIAADKCVMEFYDDHSGPTAWVYTGHNWEAEVAKMSPYSYFDNKPGWKKMDCRVPARNEIFINFLFDPKGNDDAVQSKRKSGAENREYLLSRVETALENDIIPKISRSLISAKRTANFMFGGTRVESNNDDWQHVTPASHR